MRNYSVHDRAVWEGIFAGMPAEWYDAPPSGAMARCRGYFEASARRRVLDIGCGFGRWAQYLAGHGVDEVVGLDYAEGGIRAASEWVARAGFNARFTVGSATALPFHGRPFDGALAALILDNLSRDDCALAVDELSRVVQTGGLGFFVFNPRLTPADLTAKSQGNPTSSCTLVEYEDHELAACLEGWSITRFDRSAEGFRLVEATLTG